LSLLVLRSNVEELQRNELWELRHVDYDYFVCDVRWHALQRQHMLGEGSALAKLRMLFFLCNLLHHG
jgi:hypothetical protein